MGKCKFKKNYNFENLEYRKCEICKRYYRNTIYGSKYLNEKEIDNK